MAMDMVTMSIIDSAMVAICREMGLNVQKTAYSTLFSEAKDFTCALALPTGELIAVADFIPSHIGGVPILVRSMVQEIDLATLTIPAISSSITTPIAAGCTRPSTPCSSRSFSTAS